MSAIAEFACFYDVIALSCPLLCCSCNSLATRMQLQGYSSPAGICCSLDRVSIHSWASLKLCSCHLLLLQVPQRLLMGPGPANAYPRILAAQVPCRPRHFQLYPHAADCCMRHRNHGSARNTGFAYKSCCYSIWIIMIPSRGHLPVEIQNQVVLAIHGDRHLPFCSPGSCHLLLLPDSTAAAVTAARPCPSWVTCTLPS